MVGDVKQSIYAFRGCNPDIFAKKYNMPMKVVIQNPEKPSDCREAAYTEEGVLVNSNEFNGIKNTEAKSKSLVS